MLFSFFRFFSLPFDPGLISRLRRETLSVKAGETPGSPVLSREAAALAASAAADKGIALSAEALEEYARALMGRIPLKDGGTAGCPTAAGKNTSDGEAICDRPGRDKGGHNGGGPGTEGGGAGPGQDGRRAGGGSKEGGNRRNRAVPPENLRKKLESVESNSPLLAILNMLPGKNGQRWIVIPLNLESDDTVYTVSLRILLYGEEPSRCKAERLVLAIESDIPAGTERTPSAGHSRWLFTLIKGGEPESCLDVRKEPAAADTEALKAELERSLGAYAGRIQVGALKDSVFLAEGQGEYVFPPESGKGVYY
jgi:hypothetical protein